MVKHLKLSCYVLRSARESLEDAHEHSRECQSYVIGKTYLAFANDDRLRRAVERTLQIVGEAIWQAVKVDPAVLLAVSSCRQIIGLRHRLVHEYNDISEQIVWAVVQDRLPVLDVEIKNILVDALNQQEGEDA